MPMWSKLYFQNSNSPNMDHLLLFHDHTMMIMVAILVLTMTIMLKNMKNCDNTNSIKESNEMENFWTFMPALMLMMIAIPSLKTLYMMEETIQPMMSVKVMGYQWFWSYETPTLMNKKMESIIISNDTKTRTMSASSSLIMPPLIPTRLLISSKDVLHSWAIPSMSVKADATPGRLNQINIMLSRPGLMLGQCSEICGTGHSMMPISLESPPTHLLIKP